MKTFLRRGGGGAVNALFRGAIKLAHRGAGLERLEAGEGRLPLETGGAMGGS